MVTYEVNDGEPINVGCGRNPANGENLNAKAHGNTVVSKCLMLPIKKGGLK